MIKNFEELHQIAQNNPDALEAYRLQEIERIITKARPEIRKRLRGLQFQIDMERRRAKTPMAACLKLSTMMWDKTWQLSESQAQLSEAISGSLTTPEEITPACNKSESAEIIPFRPARKTG